MQRNQKSSLPEFKLSRKAYIETVNKLEGANHEESIGNLFKV